MTREEAKELLPIIQAFAEGKPIQDKIEGITDWVDTDEINFVYEGTKIKHRIKSEQKYRPFKSQEECWGEILKHECYGWVKSKDNNDRRHISSIQKDDEDNVWFIIVSFGGIDGFSSEQMFENFEFLDGTPFGIKEE